MRSIFLSCFEFEAHILHLCGAWQVPVWKAEPSAAGSAWRAGRSHPRWGSDCRHWCAPESSEEASHVCLLGRNAVDGSHHTMTDLHSRQQTTNCSRGATLMLKSEDCGRNGIYQQWMWSRVMLRNHVMFIDMYNGRIKGQKHHTPCQQKPWVRSQSCLWWLCPHTGPRDAWHQTSGSHSLWSETDPEGTPDEPETCEPARNKYCQAVNRAKTVRLRKGWKGWENICASLTTWTFSLGSPTRDKSLKIVPDISFHGSNK